MEREFNTQVENILDVDIYPLGEHWNQMVTVESSLRTLRRDINQLKSRLKNFPDDAQAKSDLAKKLSELETTKKLNEQQAIIAQNQNENPTDFYCRNKQRGC